MLKTNTDKPGVVQLSPSGVAGEVHRLEAPPPRHLRNPGLVPFAKAGAQRLTRRGAETTHPFAREMAPHSRANTARLEAECLELLKTKGDPAPKKTLADMVADVRARQQMVMRRSARGLLGLLLDGRVKTAYEIAHKRDGNYLGYREETERAIGYFEHRPCYGYVAIDDITKGAPKEFGDMVLHLREERYANQSTCCLFDSFDQATRENFESNVFLWDDVAMLLVHQTLSGQMEEMPFLYDEIQLFRPVTPADVTKVEIPKGAVYDLLAEETRKRAPWIEVVRYDEALRSEAPTPVTGLKPTGAKPGTGYTVLNSAEAGWYQDAGGETYLRKDGPSHQLQSELFGSRLWSQVGLAAAEVVPTDGAVAVKKADATEVTSSWQTPEHNGALLESLLEAFPEARTTLLSAIVLDLVTGNLDGPQSIMRTKEGPLFIDFGGCALSRPRGEPKPERHLPPRVVVGPFLDRIEEAVTRSHPIFSAAPEEMAAIARALIDRGLLVEIGHAADWAGIEEPQRTALIHRLQTRAMSLLDPQAWSPLG